MAGARGDILSGRAYVELFVKNNRFTRGLRDAKQRLNQFGADMQAFGRQMIMVSAAAIVPLAMATKTFADFDDAMRQVKAVTGATGEEFVRMTAHTKMLGATTSFTAIEVANLKAELGRAGFNPAQIDAMTASVMNLARATGTDATLASGIMAASIRQFGLAAGDAGRVADSLTATANKSFNTVEQLGEALQYAGPVAADFNMSIEDTLAILGGLGNVGIQASSAGTALRRLLTLTGAEAQKLQGIFGVSFVDMAGNARPLVDVLGEVNAATAGMGTAERAQKFNDAFGLLGITGASAIGKSVGDIKALRAAIADAGGIAEETSKEMDAGLGGALRILSSAFEGMKIAIGEAMEGSLQSIAETGTQMLGTATAIIEKNKEVVVTFAKWAAVVGLVGAAILSLGFMSSLAATAIGGLLAIINMIAFVAGAAVGTIGMVFAALTSPLLIAGAAFAAFSVAVLSTMGVFDRLKSTMGGLFAGLKETFQNTLGGIIDALKAGDLEAAGRIAMLGLRIAFSQGLEALVGMFGGVGGEIVGALIQQLSTGDIEGAWETVIVGMAAIWESLSTAIGQVWDNVTSYISDKWQATIDGMTNYLLKNASEGGIFNEFLKATTGVDYAAEVKREQELNAKMKAAGMNTSSDSGSGYKSPSVAIQGVSDDGQVVANIEDAAAARRKAAEERIKAMQDELRLMRQGVNASFDPEYADGTAAGGGAGGAGGAGASGTAAGGAGTGSSAVTNSIQGLIAMGQGASREPMVQAVERQTKVIEKKEERAAIDRGMMIDAMNNNMGLGLV